MAKDVVFRTEFPWKSVSNTIVFCLVTCIVTASVFALPAVTLSGASGPPTTKMKVAGSGFPGSSLIDVYFDTTDMVLTVTNPKGAFSNLVLQVPAAALPGIHWITAVVRNSGLAAQKSFTVQTDWPQAGFTAKNRRSNPYENMLSPSTVGSIDLDWTFQTGETLIAPSQGVIVNGVLYVTSHDNN